MSKLDLLRTIKSKATAEKCYLLRRDTYRLMLNNLRPFIKGGFIAGLLDYLKLGACVCYMLYNHFIFL